GPRVADVAPSAALVVVVHRRQGRAHAAVLRVLERVVVDLDVGGLSGTRQSHRRLRAAAHQRRDEDLDGAAAGQLAGDVPAHAVGDGAQVAVRGDATDVEGVLVQAAHAAGVGAARALHHGLAALGGGEVVARD